MLDLAAPALLPDCFSGRPDESLVPDVSVVAVAAHMVDFCFENKFEASGVFIAASERGGRNDDRKQSARSVLAAL